MLEILSGQVQHAGFKEGLSQRYHQEALPWVKTKCGSDPFFPSLGKDAQTQLLLTARA
jgi:hypothetical protein